MRVLETKRELQAWSDAERRAGRRVALVPTMGALHRGHAALVGIARARAERVVVSIFVNPTQFNDRRDFEGYPRTVETDLAACRAAGVDVVFAPNAAEMYPEGAATWVDVHGLSEPLCGANRPGHFRGVTTVVTKLFLAARPDVAVFGEKDWQQLAVIRRMTTDLGFGIEIVGGETVRESDGLALSSRNVRLGPQARKQALCIVESLERAERMVADGEADAERILEAVRATLARAGQARIDYAELRDPASLETVSGRIEGPVLLAIALQFEPDPDGRGSAVRLIDNRVLGRRPRADA
ncbi:MAG: pantoate--beta-alanine ligase [Deltaproteobacteria bacterium]|nr:pantoate--beta-alanine ligase [Deltaproteobacteria bacterium]